MENKIIEVKLAILDRILTNVKDTTKSVNMETLVSLAGIVETFDKTEEFKKQPKSDPDTFYKTLIQTLDKVKEKEEGQAKQTEVL